MFLAEKALIIGFAAKIRVPAVYGNRDFPEVGGPMSYGISVHELHRRTAYLVDKIASGARTWRSSGSSPCRYSEPTSSSSEVYFMPPSRR